MRKPLIAVFVMTAIVLVWVGCGRTERSAESGTPVTWPELPKDGFVSGRAATQDDLKAGKSAFVVADDTGKVVGKPIQGVAVPQYAFHVEPKSGAKQPGIVIQAEEGFGKKVIGFQPLGNNGFLAGLLDEFQMLGTDKPTK